MLSIPILVSSISLQYSPDIPILYLDIYIYMYIHLIDYYILLTRGFLVGGFKHVLFSIKYGIILPIDLYFSEGLKPPTRSFKHCSDVASHEYAAIPTISPFLSPWHYSDYPLCLACIAPVHYSRVNQHICGKPTMCRSFFLGNQCFFTSMLGNPYRVTKHGPVL